VILLFSVGSKKGLHPVGGDLLSFQVLNRETLGELTGEFILPVIVCHESAGRALPVDGAFAHSCRRWAKSPDHWSGLFSLEVNYTVGSYFLESTGGLRARCTTLVR
jgi:hypothetical protein